jgi:hypothetical protein
MKMTAAATASGHQLRGGVYPSIATRVIEWLSRTWSFLVLRNKSNVFAEPAASTGTVTMFRLSPLASPGVLRCTTMFCARFDSSTTVPRPDRLHQLVLQDDSIVVLQQNARVSKARLRIYSERTELIEVL